MTGALDVHHNIQSSGFTSILFSMLAEVFPLFQPKTYLTKILNILIVRPWYVPILSNILVIETFPKLFTSWNNVKT